MFTSKEREEIRESIIAFAKEDKRVVAAAVIGSYAKGTVDKWSDIDLTFATKSGESMDAILESWTEYIRKAFFGKKLFDLYWESTVYMVFILPSCLQIDISFTTEKEFGTNGDPFEILYGNKIEKPQPEKQKMEEVFGYLVHHLLRARVSVERDKLWQGLYWVSEARNYALKLSCMANKLETDYGRGFDRLPQAVLDSLEGSLISKPEPREIVYAIYYIIKVLPLVSEEVNHLCETFREQLNQLTIGISFYDK